MAKSALLFLNMFFVYSLYMQSVVITKVEDYFLQIDWQITLPAKLSDTEVKLDKHHLCENENANMFENIVPIGIQKYKINSFNGTRNMSKELCVKPFFILLANKQLPSQLSWPYFKQHRNQLFVLFSLMVMVIGVSWFFFNIEKRQQAIKDDFAKQLSAYKLIALKAQVNPHFMSNCLSSIQNLIMKNENDKALYYVSQFGTLVRKVLSYSDKLFITLGEEMEITRLYIEMEQLRFDHKFEYKPVCDPNLNVHSVYVPPMILNPIVENAIWHGLLPRTQKHEGLLEIDLRIQHQQLVICIRDNGVGRGEHPEGKQAFGTNLTKQRLHNVDFLIHQQQSKLSYTDYKDRGGKALGTEVEMLLPIILTPKNYEKNKNHGSG